MKNNRFQYKKFVKTKWPVNRKKTGLRTSRAEEICTAVLRINRPFRQFTNDLLHKTTYIPIKLALFWVMLDSWPFESKQTLTWPFQRGIIQLCRSKGCQMTSPQSRSLELRSRERFGVARHLRRRRVLAERAPIPPNSILLPDFEGW